MINILYITSQLNKTMPENKYFNLSLILFRNGLNTTRENENYLLKLIFDKDKKININIQMEIPLEDLKLLIY